MHGHNDSDRNRLPTTALMRFWWARGKFDIYPAVNLQVQKGIARVDAEDAVNSLIQIIVSHGVSETPAYPYVFLGGRIHDLYDSLRLDRSSLFSRIATSMKLQWGNIVLDGVLSPKVEAFGGIDYTLKCLESDFGTYITPGLKNWRSESQKHGCVPVALFWANEGNKVLPRTQDLRNPKMLGACWPQGCTAKQNTVMA